MSNNTPTTPTPLSVIFAGEEFLGQDAAHPLIEIRTADGTSKIAVRVREMPARHLGQVARLATNDAALVDFVCMVSSSEDGEIAGWQRVPAGWADNLTDESHALLYEAAKRLNFTRAATWVERQIAAKQFSGELMRAAEEQLMPMIMEMIAPVLKEIAGSLGSSSKPSAARVPADSTKS